jgi:hypothetical protein
MQLTQPSLRWRGRPALTAPDTRTKLAKNRAKSILDLKVAHLRAEDLGAVSEATRIDDDVPSIVAGAAFVAALWLAPAGVLWGAGIILIPLLAAAVTAIILQRFEISPAGWVVVRRSARLLVAAVFFAIAIATARRPFHTVCDQEVRTHDGMECVGDYVPVKGPDWFFVVVYGVCAGAAVWAAARVRDSEVIANAEEPLNDS